MPTVLILLLILLTVLALGAGLVVMVRGGKWNAQYSNKLMVLRVALQASVILALAAAAALSGK